MEEDNGLELSLGLSCGGSNGKQKGKDGSSSDVKIEEGGGTNKLMGDLKNFLHTSVQKLDGDDGSQRSDAAQSGLVEISKENFFTNLAKSGSVGDASADFSGSSAAQFARYGEQWASNNKSPEVEEVKVDHNGNGSKQWLEAGNKRKMLFEELNRQKKHERENQFSDMHGKKSPVVSTSVRASHVSLTNEDGSTAENEDVAESEVEGSTSGLVLHHEDGTKHYMGAAHGLSEASKERYSQKQSNAPSGNDLRHGSIGYGTSLPQMNVQYALTSKMSSFNGESNTSGFHSSPMMQLIPPASNEGPGSQTINPGNLPLTFGYSPVQLPTLNSERSWGLISHPLQMPSSYAGRSISSGVPNSDRSEDGSHMSRGVLQAHLHSSLEALTDERKASELTKGGGNQHATEEGGASSSTPAEDEMKGNRTKEAYHTQSVDNPLEGSAIRPGIAPGMKFGGSGSYPDLPWVSTTGPGPNGRTISGVTYRFDKNQIRIVCACHGFHMSPEEFIQHASGDQPNSENNTGLASFPNGNPAASAQS